MYSVSELRVTVTELVLDIQGPCLLDCRQPVSEGISQISHILSSSALKLLELGHWASKESTLRV